MNKNKLIFAIIWVILLIFIIFVALNLRKDTAKTQEKSAWVFNIWVVWDDVEWVKKVVENFQKVNTKYASQKIEVNSFTSFDDYHYALSSSIISWKSPDVFVLNNNEKSSMFSNQIIWVNPSVVNPNDFRKKYKWVFTDDLIISSWEWEQKQEYLQWIPVWYETFWIFYNRRYIKETDLSSISSLNNVVSNLKKDKPELVPIWIWNGSTVDNVSDIITQFFMLETWISWLEDVNWNKMKQSLSSYMLYWDVDWDNAYNSRFNELSNLGQTSVDLFSKWETFMLVWYPRLINKIKEKWFSKNFLLASPFPHYFSWDWKTLVNYNYFVINKDSTNQELANSFLWYLSSDVGALEYFKNFKYYLPALLSLESDQLKEKISDDYNIILENFISSDHELSSFDKWVKNIYDKNIISILDNVSNYEKPFENFRKSVLCKAKKISTLEDLSTNCDEVK